MGISTQKMGLHSMAWLGFIIGVLMGCQPGNEPAYFEVKGRFAHTVSNKIFLAELPFGSTHRTIVDTAQIGSDGNFSLQTISKGEGIYQLFVQNGPGIMLISDTDKLVVTADAQNLPGYSVLGSNANAHVKNLFITYLQADSTINHTNSLYDSLVKTKARDTVLAAIKNGSNMATAKLKATLANFIKTEPNGTAVYFALGMARQYFQEQEWANFLTDAIHKFPKHPVLQILKVNAATTPYLQP